MQHVALWDHCLLAYIDSGRWVAGREGSFDLDFHSSHHMEALEVEDSPTCLDEL
jgi:hypothetical protein